MRPAFGTQMLWVTFVFVVLEALMFFYQAIYCLCRPQEKPRLYYLILLFLLIVYNITGGLFPDPHIRIGLVAQNSIAYGSGFLMAAYFPYYFYKGFELERLRFHAVYGVFLFLLLPYLVFFVILYALNKDLAMAIDYGIVVPFFYSIVLLWAILRAIQSKYRHHKSREHFVEVVGVYLAVFPWVAMTVIAYFGLGQFVEAVCTNGGFVVITFVFLYQSVIKARKEYRVLNGMETGKDRFLLRCQELNLTPRETQIVHLVRHGHTYQAIGEMLFISELTVKKHVCNMFEKVGAKNKVELLCRLENRGS